MKFVTGKDKFPLIEIKENIYLHIFPVTKYQFERFLWNVSPESINYKEILKDSLRIPPYGLKNKKLNNLFITQISFEEANQYAQWMEGEIPKFDIILEFEKKFGNLNFSEIKKGLSNDYNEIDLRFWKLLESLEEIKIDNLKILLKNLDGGELCYNDEFKSNIFIKMYGVKTTCELTGDEPHKTRWNHSFRILKKTEGG